MKQPSCKNPQHPSGASSRMLFLEEKAGVYVFACQACKDINHVISTQVLTSAALRKSVRSKAAAEGRLLNAPPPIREPQMAPRRRQVIRWNGRKSTDGRYELIHYEHLKDGELKVQMAVDGVLAPMMDDHIASREEYPTDDQYFTRVAESSELMIHLYGDARSPLSETEVNQRQQQTF